MNNSAVTCRWYCTLGSSHEVVVAAGKEGQFIVWKFELEDFDVDFSVRFTPLPYEQPVELVHSRTRYLATSAGRPVEGGSGVIHHWLSAFVLLSDDPRSLSFFNRHVPMCSGRKGDLGVGQLVLAH